MSTPASDHGAMSTSRPDRSEIPRRAIIGAILLTGGFSSAATLLYTLFGRYRHVRHLGLDPQVTSAVTHLTSTDVVVLSAACVLGLAGAVLLIVTGRAMRPREDRRQ